MLRQYQRIYSQETMLPYLLCFSIAASTVIALNNVNDNYHFSGKNCTSLECVLLDNLILNDIDKYGDPCKDVSSYLCSNDTFSFEERVKLSSESLFKSKFLLNLTISILNGSKQHEFSENKLKSLKIEKELFKTCMKLGENKNISEVSISKEFNGLRTKNESFDSWQDIDEEFNSLGFGYAFFEIKIVRNPRCPDSNIIMLQPPIDHSLKIFAKATMSSFPISRIFREQNTDLIHIPHQNVTRFLSSLIQIILDKSDNIKPDEFFEAYISIEKWNETYNYHYANHTTAQIDWLYIFTHTFRQVNININKTEIIFINNKNYFIRLAKILSTTPNKVIAEAITLIWKLQNPAYYGLLPSETLALQDGRKIRSFDCIVEMQLYATSYVILHVWESDEKVTEQRRYLLNKITKAMQNEIFQLQSLHKNAKLYYSKKLNDITLKAIRGDWNQSLVSNYYSDLKLTDNYFTNILNYKKLIRNKRLINLRNSPDTVMEGTPFSLVELLDIRNNLIIQLQTMFGNKDEVLINRLMSASKEIMFSTNGVKLAGFIYLLLTNDLFNAKTFPAFDNPKDIFRYFSREIDDRKTRSFFQSLLSNGTAKYYYMIDDIVDSFAIRVAYKAMLNENCDRTSESICDTITNELGLTSEKLFFLAYAKSNCNRSTNFTKVDDVILCLEEYVKVFRCSNKNSIQLYRSHREQICNLTLFDNYEGIFSDT